MSFRVVLDACVLIPYYLCDTLLHLADARFYVPLWSEALLDEVGRNLIEQIGEPPDRVAKRIGAMTEAFPYATVTGYENLIPAMTNHPKDRHVLAAAVQGGASIIVTANMKDFPTSSLEPHEIKALTPDEFLLDLLDLNTDVALMTLGEQRAAYENPHLSAENFFEALSTTVPSFAERAGELERQWRDC